MGRGAKVESSETGMPRARVGSDRVPPGMGVQPVHPENTGSDSLRRKTCPHPPVCLLDPEDRLDRMGVSPLLHLFCCFCRPIRRCKKDGKGKIPAGSSRLLPGPAPWTFPDPQAGFPTRVSIQHLSRRGIHFRRDPDPEPGRFPPRIRGTHAPLPAWEAFSTRACHIPVYRSAIFREFPPGGGNGSPGRFLQRNPDVLWRFQNPSERICRSLGSPPAARLPPLSSISLALQWMPSSSPSRPWISG